MVNTLNSRSIISVFRISTLANRTNESLLMRTIQGNKIMATQFTAKQLGIAAVIIKIKSSHSRSNRPDQHLLKMVALTSEVKVEEKWLLDLR